MSELPSGAVTFLFSDIEGSTRLVKALRDRYAQVLAEHRRLVRAAIAGHRGHEVDTQGGWPAALTSFVGRAAQVDEVTGLLGEFRLVTVMGPGGAGKTRLAGEVARRAAAQFADGAWLVELGPVRDPAQLASVVAAALGVREQPDLPAADALARVLARQQLLLVLDNRRAGRPAAAGRRRRHHPAGPGLGHGARSRHRPAAGRGAWCHGAHRPVVSRPAGGPAGILRQALTGTVPQIAAAMRGYADLGVRHIMFQCAPYTPEASRRLTEALRHYRAAGP